MELQKEFEKYLKLGLNGVVIGGVIVLSPDGAIAQIVPDTTLPINSSVTPGCTNCLINGGTERGVNLYHSFREFSIPTGGSAWFNNAPQIQTILTRVTGNSISTIDGLLRANGTANLFLLNPNGIVFGANARLQIGGSFFASTASSFNFFDGSEFSATNPQAPPLLTVNITPGLQYGRPIGTISNTGNLAVGSGQTLALFGSTVSNSGSLTAPGGTVQVLGDRVALLDNAVIDVSAVGGGGTVLIGGDFQGRGTVPTAKRTFVSPTATINANAIDIGNGGQVIVWSDEATRFYGTVNAKGGDRFGNGGFVEVSGKQFLDYQGQVNTLAPNGLPGTLLLDPTNIEVVASGGNTTNLADVDQFADPDLGVNGTQLNVAAINNATANVILQATNNITFSTDVDIAQAGVGLTAEAGNTITVQEGLFSFLGFDNDIRTNGGAVQFNAGNAITVNSPIQTNGGAIQFNAGNTIAFQGSVSLFGSVPAAVTNGGTVTLNSGADTILSSFAIRADRASGGNSGDITITTGATGRLILQNRGVLFADSFGAGRAGNITLQASEVNVSTPPGQASISGISASASGTGNAGIITINTGRLAVSDAPIQASSTGGDAGQILVRANQVALDGQGNLSRTGGLIANTNANTGRPGTIVLDTQQLSVQGGAGIYVSTTAANRGGNLTIRASEIDLTGSGRLPSSLSVGALAQFGGTGDGGTMQITTDRLTVREGAVIDASAFFRRAGDVNIQATTINLLNGGEIGADGRQGGTIRLNTAQLQVSDASFISASALQGIGGNLLIRASDRVSVENSRILANAIDGQGGNIDVETRNLTLQNLSLLSSGALGIGVAGNLTVRATDSVLLDRSFLGLTSLGTVTGGNLAIATGDLTVQNAGQITTTLIGQGSGGNINLNANNLTLKDSGYIATSIVGQGQGGNLTIQVNDSIQLDDRGVISTSTFGAGTGGNLAISARQLDLSNQSTINTLSIDSLDSLTRSEIFTVPQFSAIQPSSPFISDINRLVTTAVSKGSAMGVQGNAGELTVQVSDRITIANQSSLATAASGKTNGAKLFLQTGDLNLVNEGALRSDIDGQGRGGDIEVRANNLQLQTGLISSRGFNLGTAANININLNNALNSDSGAILASSDRSGGGDISIVAEDIRLRNNSLISTSVFDSTGGGGNINIRSNIFLILENSDILANAEFGPGGDILINSPVFLADLFGSGRATAVGRNPGRFAQFRGNSRVDISANANRGSFGLFRVNSRVDISALSSAGTSGTVTVPNFDLNRGLSQLPEDLIDTDRILANSCIVRRGNADGVFLVTGKGGFSEQPGSTVPMFVTGAVRGVEKKEEGRRKKEEGESGAIVEAQGIYQLPDGQIILSWECGRR